MACLPRIRCLPSGDRREPADVLLPASSFQRLQGHDPQGECATHIALQFPSFKKAKKFCHLASREGFHAMVASESRHVYSDWTMLLQKKGAHHPLRNPLLRTKRSYYKNSNPQTLDILSRTAILRCDPDTRKDS